MTARRFRAGGAELEVEASFKAGRLRVVHEGTHEFGAESVAGGQWLLRGEDGRSHPVLVARRGETWWIHADGRTHVLEAAAPRSSSSQPGELTAPMTGKVVEVLAAEGERVAAGAPLLVLSAMKMQVEVRAPVAGTVTRLVPRRGDQVEGGTVVAVVEPTSRGAR